MSFKKTIWFREPNQYKQSSERTKQKTDTVYWQMSLPGTRSKTKLPNFKYKFTNFLYKVWNSELWCWTIGMYKEIIISKSPKY
jgi:hypothetical protein